MPATVYKSPLIPVRPRVQTQKLLGCDLPKEKVPYSKYTVPHFMDVDDEEKYIVHGNFDISHFTFDIYQFINSILFKFVISFHLELLPILLCENYWDFCVFY